MSPHSYLGEPEIIVSKPALNQMGFHEIRGKDMGNFI